MNDSDGPMHIFLHDYAGHPFQVELSRTLVSRGHRVTHCYFAGDKGPKGDFVNRPGDGGRLNFAPIDISGDYDKTSYVSRFFNDRAYGKRAAEAIVQARPDVVISGNTPPDAQKFVKKGAEKAGAAFVSWIQDFYSIGISRVLGRKLGALAKPICARYRSLEGQLLRGSDAIVIVTEEFRAEANRLSGGKVPVVTIENWGPLSQVQPSPKMNMWAVAQGLADSFNFVYSGTMAMKHNPEFLINLARETRNQPEVKVVLISHGIGVDAVRRAKEAEKLDNVVILPLQDFKNFAMVLGSADVLIAVIEADAGVYSVPSKVQSYLCAQRPILLAAPPENLAAKVVTREQSGLVVAPDDMSGFLRGARQLHEDGALRKRLAENGFSYAKRAYDVEAIATRFLEVFEEACHGAPQQAGQPVLATSS